MSTIVELASSITGASNNNRNMQQHANMIDTNSNNVSSGINNSNSSGGGGGNNSNSTGINNNSNTLTSANSLSSSNNNNTNTNTNNNNNNLISSGVQDSNPILQRMKEMEQTMQEMQRCLENANVENRKKEDQIKKLEQDKIQMNAERAKEMKKIYDTGVQEWLKSLDGIPPEILSQLEKGILELTDSGDMHSKSWQIVCNASEHHKKQLHKIETLIQDCNDKDKTIKDLLDSRHDDNTFASIKSRVSYLDSNNNGGERGNIKRPFSDSVDSMMHTRTVDPGASDSNHANMDDRGAKRGRAGNSADAWDVFSDMLCKDSKNIYY